MLGQKLVDMQPSVRMNTAARQVTVNCDMFAEEALAPKEAGGVCVKHRH
jgi:hypothetical protein